MIISAKEQGAWDAACAAALANPASGRTRPEDLADWAAKCADAVILLRRERQGR